MSTRSNELLEEALALPPTERAEIAERLLSSLDTPDRQRIDRLWAIEAEERVKAFDRGDMEAIPAKQVFDQIHRKTK